MRTRLALAVVTVLVLVAGMGTWALTRSKSDSTEAALVAPDSAAVARAEVARRTTNAVVREVNLTAAPATVDLGGRRVESWTFNGTLPGPTIHASAGEVIRATVVNELPEPLTVHWHGIALRNDMDGVPDLTQKPIQPGDSLVYEFTAPDPGTYMYHPHTGVQLDRGLYGALVIDDPKEAKPALDVPLLLDDWIEGTGQSPDQVLANLKAGGANMAGMPGMSHGNAALPSSADSPLGADITDVVYPEYLVNGRDPSNPEVFEVNAGDTVRLRLINIGSATPFRVAFGGGPLTVIATDGYPVQPVEADAVLVAMGERYDVQVTVTADGAFPLVAAAEGQGMQGLAVLRTDGSTLPSASVHPAGLDGRLLTLADLQGAPNVTLDNGKPDRNYKLNLTGDMMAYNWSITAPQDDGATLPVKFGDRVRLTLTNNTAMWHPVHLHGHTFQVVNANGSGPRKDTVIVGPNATVTVDFIADNPGQWALHCHNIYHAEVGMVTVLSYLA